MMKDTVLFSVTHDIYIRGVGHGPVKISKAVKCTGGLDFDHFFY